ncbi:12626_t:CDS:2 [Ambispora gerdemannii]|uniref:12626_t:CDS:1 n=1 Tax=Ambispora gerdemannii TaxID=144530 RepID=A0A9N9AZN2_9GLOM|nr:12626_t:CDS:2 [Ambispora gerdemannii]
MLINYKHLFSKAVHQFSPLIKVEIHHTDDGKTSRIKFRAAPKRVHPNESKSFGEKFGELFRQGGKEESESKKFRGQAESNQDNKVGSVEQNNSGSQLSNKVGGEESDKNVSEIGSSMDIDQFETSTNENLGGSSTTDTSLNLLSDYEIERAEESQLIDLMRRVKKELEIRKELKKHSNSDFRTSNYQVSTHDLENCLSRVENSLKSFQTSNTTNTTLNNDNKGSDAGGVLAVVGVVSALAVGSLVLVKRKLEQNYSCSCVMGGCNHPCASCGKNTLASIQPNANDTGYSLIKQMVGEAQRKARRTGERGDIEVSRTVINSNGEYYCQILVYNTHTKLYRSN